MAFNKNLPANATKIRNYPQVLTDNFKGIQEGDLTLTHWQVNFIERNSVAPPIANDPTRQDDTMILYSKQDASGETELFALDDRNPANVIQLTQDGAMGSIVTDINAQSISFDGTFQNTQNSMVTAWSNVIVVGAAISTQTNYGMTWARVSTGIYDATFTASQVTNANYAVIGVGYSSTGSTENNVVSVCAACPKTTSTFRIFIRNAADNALRDASFSVAIFGGR